MPNPTAYPGQTVSITAVYHEVSPLIGPGGPAAGEWAVTTTRASYGTAVARGGDMPNGWLVACAETVVYQPTASPPGPATVTLSVTVPLTAAPYIGTTLFPAYSVPANYAPAFGGGPFAFGLGYVAALDIVSPPVSLVGTGTLSAPPVLLLLSSAALVGTGTLSIAQRTQRCPTPGVFSEVCPTLGAFVELCPVPAMFLRTVPGLVPVLVGLDDTTPGDTNPAGIDGGTL